MTFCKIMQNPASVWKNGREFLQSLPFTDAVYFRRELIQHRLGRVPIHILGNRFIKFGRFFYII